MSKIPNIELKERKKKNVSTTIWDYFEVLFTDKRFYFLFFSIFLSFFLFCQPSLRSIWEKYYEEAHAVVFVIDAFCPSRFEDSKSALGE